MATQVDILGHIVWRLTTTRALAWSMLLLCSLLSEPPLTTLFAECPSTIWACEPTWAVSSI
jgi:hypothetical protein